MCWIWDRVNTHNCWHLNWMPWLATSSNCCSPRKGLKLLAPTDVPMRNVTADNQQKTLNQKVREECNPLLPIFSSERRAERFMADTVRKGVCLLNYAGIRCPPARTRRSDYAADQQRAAAYPLRASGGARQARNCSRALNYTQLCGAAQRGSEGASRCFGFLSVHESAKA